MSTGDLVRRAAQGDAEAWRALVGRYSRLLCSIARSYGLSGADADDVVQTTWLRLVERLTLLRDPARAGAWLAVTARHESMATLRRAGRERPLKGTGPTVTGPHHVVFGRDLGSCWSCSPARRGSATRRSPRRSICRSAAWARRERAASPTCAVASAVAHEPAKRANRTTRAPGRSSDEGGPVSERSERTRQHAHLAAPPTKEDS
jgi:RNA polymerase sigma factor (sigma-70 family)